MIDQLRKNIQTEIEMLREISSYVNRIPGSSYQEKKLLEGAIKYLRSGMKTVNGAIPDIVKNITLSRKLPFGSKKIVKKTPLRPQMVAVKDVQEKYEVSVSRKEKSKFLKELSLSEGYIKRLKKRKIEEKEKYEEFKASRGYLKLANKMFLDYANKQIKQGKFKPLAREIRKADIDILFEGYIAMMYFTSFLSIFAGIIITIILLFFNVGLTWPFFSLYDGSYLIRIAQVFWIIFTTPILTFLLIYYFPSAERKSIGKRIEQELPFSVIHMSAISGSGIEPSEIFKIIGTSREYPYLRKEIRKILNQINLYGYDLVTALNNAAKTSPSERLAELFTGLATSITSGANISGFLEKRAETLLLNYRLERERYTKLIETFLDIYISLVIAAPMIFLLLLIMISISGIQVAFTSGQLSLISVASVAFLNIIFLVFLHLKQPTY